MYYVIKTTYAGPNPEQHLNDDTIDIVTQPPRGNSDPYPIITDGWCGTTNDWSREAHGAHETLEAARAKVREVTEGNYRANVPDMTTIEGQCAIEAMQDDGIVESYRIGLRPQWNEEESCDFAESLKDSITADSTEQELETLVEEARQEAQMYWQVELDTEAVYHMLTETRGDAIENAREPANDADYAD